MYVLYSESYLREVEHERGRLSFRVRIRVGSVTLLDEVWRIETTARRTTQDLGARQYESAPKGQVILDYTYLPNLPSHFVDNYLEGFQEA